MTSKFILVVLAEASSGSVKTKLALLLAEHTGNPTIPPLTAKTFSSRVNVITFC